MLHHALVLLLASSGLALAQGQPAAPGPARQGAPQAGTAPGAGACEDMKKHHEEMKAEMQKMNAALDQKVAAMNAARGNAKVDAMASVVNELVAQRKQMAQRMELFVLRVAAAGRGGPGGDQAARQAPVRHSPGHRGGIGMPTSISTWRRPQEGGGG